MFSRPGRSADGIGYPAAPTQRYGTIRVRSPTPRHPFGVERGFGVPKQFPNGAGAARPLLGGTMTRTKTLLWVLFPILIAAIACNLPTSLGGQGRAQVVMIVSVGAATEYRTGPGEGYALVGMINPGQEVEAVGQSPDGNYLLIKDPANPVALGWLKRDDTTVKGDPVKLPISTAPPTPTLVPGSTLVINCPTPVGGGPTPVSCGPVQGPTSVGGCPTPVGGGPTPVSCGPATGPTLVSGCPTPIGGGPTPVSCGPATGPTLVRGCPTPIGGGPTPVSCGPASGPTLVPGCPTPIGGGPTPVSCRPPIRHPTQPPGPTLVPTLVK